MDLVDHLEHTIQQQHLLRPRASVVVAVSGGVDSMVLLDALFRLAPRHQWKLNVAHLNHQLRGAESDRDQQLVENTARELGLPCCTDQAEVHRLQEQTGLSLEMAARHRRHEFLARIASQLRSPAVALAHHANDQVELFFIRLLRGAGGSGLRGMRWQSLSPVNPRVRLIRPLLDLPKSVLEHYAADRQLEFVQDSSNLDRTILRNQIRQELIPLLLAKYQPALLTQIQRAMDIIGHDADTISDAAGEWLDQKRRKPFAQLPIAVQRQVVWRQLLARKLEPRFEAIEQLRLNPDLPMVFQSGLTLQLSSRGELTPLTSAPLAFNPEQIKFELKGTAGEIRFGQRWIRWQLLPRSSLAAKPWKNRSSVQATAGQGIEFFDAAKVGARITLRYWQPGDRFRPIGLSTPAKLQNLLTNAKVPRFERTGLLLGATTDGEIFWVERLRMGDVFKLDKMTRQCLKWEWQRLPGGGKAVAAEAADE